MMISPCPLCNGTNRYYSFQLGQERFDECWDCELLEHKIIVEEHTRTKAEKLFELENTESFDQRFFDLLTSYSELPSGRIGILGQTSKTFLKKASSYGFTVNTNPLTQRQNKNDILIVVHLLECNSTPSSYLQHLRKFLKPHGVLCIISKRLVKAELRKSEKTILNSKQRYSFSEINFQALLLRSGFENTFSQTYLERKDFIGHTIVFGRKGEIKPRHRLSIIVPIYNEVKTTALVLDNLLKKRIHDVELEIIVVESASTDGSREVVLNYQNKPNIKIILQDKPLGKGFAVREGLKASTGDIIIIQDADLEYDLLDYEMLLSPIVTGRAAFVLGTRHAGHWKIRQFNEQFMMQDDLMNVGHWILVYIMNHLYHQNMTDPFTMFKVFRRDCLFGLTFECNRFDFDVELVCKLLRKGYTPKEIPVNYRSRSFSEGKKVNMLRDPLTWIKAILKYRFTRVFELPTYRNGRVPQSGKALGNGLFFS